MSSARIAGNVPGAAVASLQPAAALAAAKNRTVTRPSCWLMGQGYRRFASHRPHGYRDLAVQARQYAGAVRSPQEYLESLLADLRPLPPIDILIDDLAGSTLAADVSAAWDVPAFDNSAMDGYAVRSSDVASANAGSPVRLTVIEDIPAGAWPTQAITAGTCARIMTGAPLPQGADCVIRVEDTDGGSTTVAIGRTGVAGRDVRRRGEDIHAGATVLYAGQRMNARTIAALAAAGHDRALAHPRARVAVISTGSELVPAGQPISAAQITDVNGPMLEAAVRGMGARVRRLPAQADDAGQLLKVLYEAASSADLVVTTGGVSMGAYDTVKQVLRDSGEAVFEKLAMQPGMPQGRGRLGPAQTPILTLPGNPVSAFVSAQLFVRPMLDRLHGHVATLAARPQAISGAAWDSPADKVQYVRARLDDSTPPVAVPAGVQGSHILGGLAQADCLLIVPAGQQRVAPGQLLDMIDLRQESL